MVKIMVGVYDHATGENITREATAEEIAILENSRKEIQEAQAIQEAKISARNSALAKLIDLGLTEEEIAAL